MSKLLARSCVVATLFAAVMITCGTSDREGGAAASGGMGPGKGGSGAAATGGAAGVDASAGGTGTGGTGAGGASAGGTGTGGTGATGGGAVGGSGGADGAVDAGSPVICQPGGSVAQATIGKTGGTLSSMDGLVKLTVPDGALAQDTVITIAKATCTATNATSIYDFGPNGTVFAKPVLIEMPYDPTQLAGEDPLELISAYLAGGKWHEVATRLVDIGTSTIGTVTDHFTDYGHVFTQGGVAVEPSPPCGTKCTKDACTLNGGTLSKRGGACAVSGSAQLAVYTSWINCAISKQLASAECGCWDSNVKLGSCSGDPDLQAGTCCPDNGLTCSFTGGLKTFAGCCQTFTSPSAWSCPSTAVEGGIVTYIKLSVNLTRYACVATEPGDAGKGFFNTWPYQYRCRDPVCTLPPCL